MEKYSFPEKCLFLENFSPISCEKLCTRSLLDLNHPCLLTSISAAKNYTLVRVGMFLQYECWLKNISGPWPSLTPFCRHQCSAHKNTSLIQKVFNRNLTSAYSRLNFLEPRLQSHILCRMHCDVIHHTQTFLSPKT